MQEGHRRLSPPAPSEASEKALLPVTLQALDLEFVAQAAQVPPSLASEPQQARFPICIAIAVEEAALSEEQASDLQLPFYDVSPVVKDTLRTISMLTRGTWRQVDLRRLRYVRDNELKVSLRIVLEESGGLPSARGFETFIAAKKGVNKLAMKPCQSYIPETGCLPGAVEAFAEEHWTKFKGSPHLLHELVVPDGKSILTATATKRNIMPQKQLRTFLEAFVCDAFNVSPERLTQLGIRYHGPRQVLVSVADEDGASDETQVLFGHWSQRATQALVEITDSARRSRSQRKSTPKNLRDRRAELEKELRLRFMFFGRIQDALRDKIWREVVPMISRDGPDGDALTSLAWLPPPAAQPASSQQPAQSSAAAESISDHATHDTVDAGPDPIDLPADDFPEETLTEVDDAKDAEE